MNNPVSLLEQLPGAIQTVSKAIGDLNNIVLDLAKMGIASQAAALPPAPEKPSRKAVQKIYYTPIELREIFDCTRQNVYQLIRDKKIKVSGEGRNKRIHASELEKKIPFFNDKLAKWEESKQSKVA